MARGGFVVIQNKKCPTRAFFVLMRTGRIELPPAAWKAAILATIRCPHNFIASNAAAEKRCGEGEILRQRRISLRLRTHEQNGGGRI